MNHSAPFLRYQLLLTALRRGPTKYGPAPHKPVLLLSLVDRMEESGGTPAIPLDARLMAIFQENWHRLVPTGNKPDITLPLHHLADGLGWQLTNERGEPVKRKFSGPNQVLAHHATGRFDKEFGDFLRDSDHRMMVRMILLDSYFPHTQANYLAARPLPAYVIDIEQSVMAEPDNRRRYTRQVEGYVRDWKFRKAVLQAYDHTCCMSGLQVNTGTWMVQACHIQPHALAGPDHVTNGLALCPNLHLAFDNGLVGLRDDLRILVRQDLRESESRYGLRQLAGMRIALPVERRFHPNREFLRQHRQRFEFPGR